MSEIGRQCEDVPIDAVSIGRDRFFQGSDGEPMPQIVEPWARHAGTSSKSRGARELDEHAGENVRVDGLAGREHEDMVVRSADPLSDGQIAAECVTCARVQRNQS